MRIQRWDSELSTEETNVFAKEVAAILLSRILDTETRRTLRDFIDRDDFLALSDFCVNYSCTSVADAIAIRQLLGLFSKRRDLGDDVAREINALRTFRDAERLCMESNHIFRRWSQGGFQFPPDVESCIFAAQRKIARVLGDVPLLSELHIRFGPGSTTNVPKRSAGARNKLSAPLACSGDLSGSLEDCLMEVPGWLTFSDEPDSVALATVEIHPGRLVFVPKDRKTFRAIGPEPVLNGMFQLGIGLHMAQCLKRSGVDITDQSRNQKLAMKGSIDGGLATLDLSSASDTISIGVVEHLLPIDWFLFLSRFRTGLLEYGDQLIELEKFSTMGNGFTFPLETLIFWALAQSVCESRDESESVSVYGDDIIVPAHRYHKLVRVLNALGFLVNDKKSFASGPFRESCGADYLSGINIRPYYLRDRLTGESAFSCYNFFKRAYDDEICDLIRSYLDPTMILYGPDGFGDGHLISDDPQLQVHPSCGLKNRGFGGYTFETYTWKAKRAFALLPGDRVLPCYSIYVSGGRPPEDELTFRDRYYAISVRGTNIVDPTTSQFTAKSPVSFVYRKGILGAPIPGKHGYKRIKIYTFG